LRLLLISVYPPSPAPEANHALHLSEHLADAGVEVHVLCQKGSVPSTHPNVVLHPLMENWSFGEIGKVREAIAKAQPDAVFLVYLGWIYGQSVMVTVLPSIVARLRPGIPFITQFEAIEGPNIEQPWLRRLIRNCLAKLSRGSFHKQFGSLLTRSTELIALSNPHMDALVGEFAPVAEKSVVIPTPPLIRMSKSNPILTRAQVRARFGIADDDFLFLFWGHIYPGKGLETLLLAFDPVRKEIPNARLMIVGGSLAVSKSLVASSEYYQMVRELPDRIGIGPLVKWTGPFAWDSEAGSEFLYAGDACVLPFDWGVTFNNSTLAAAATHGLPVIATKVNGKPDPALVHGENVYFCQPRDPVVLADAMKQLVVQPAFRDRLRRGGLALSKEWHQWPSVAGKLKQTIEASVAKVGLPATATDPNPIARAPALDHKESSPANYGPSDPLVSVIVAAYNVEKYLSQCLDSLVHQTLSGIEIIAVDDASTDGSLSILKKYAAKHPNVRVIALRSNVGLASVRNIGLQNARGTYVAFLDGDDWADTRMCEILHQAASSVDADLVSGSATVFYDDDVKRFAPLFDSFQRARISPFAKSYCFKISEEPAALLLEVVAWTKIYKRKFLSENQLKFEDGFNSYEDMCFHVKTMLKADRIRVIDDPTVFYRQSRPGQISAMTNRKKFQIFDIFRIIHDALFEAKASPEIWAQVVRLELRQYDWMMKNRVSLDERKEFIKRAAVSLQTIPAEAWSEVRFWGIHDAAKSVAMRRGWPKAFALADGPSTRAARLLCMSSKTILSAKGVFGEPQPSNLAKLPSVGDRTTGRIKRSASAVGSAPKSLRSDLQVSVHTIRGLEILITNAKNVNVADAIWRTENDHFLTQVCIFREDDIVVVIGADMGIGAIHLGKMYPFLKIYAIEPDPIKFSLLTRNIEINRADNVMPINIAVSEVNGGTTLFSGSPDNSWRTTNPAFAVKKDQFKVREVESKTLSALFDELQIKECRMLKISAWGSVKSILAGITPNTNIDYLCGEVDVEDCNLATLEVTSWRHSRQHFWRVWKTTPGGQVWSTVMQLPTGPFSSAQQQTLTTRRENKRPVRARGAGVAPRADFEPHP